MQSTDNEVIIFYKYTDVEKPEEFAAWMREFVRRANLHGTALLGRVIIAKEGINGTLEGTKEAIATYEEALRTTSYGDFSDVWFKHSAGTPTLSAFPKFWVRVREEIVTLRLAHTKDGDVDPRTQTATHIEPEELKKWYENGEQFEIIDMRNTYEYELGHFKGALDPQTESFYDLPAVVKNFEHLKDKKVLTVCTYGVRCEKASAFLKQQGFANVYQLNGGIGTYMKKFPGQEFEGSLYVFDSRLAENFTDNYTIIGKCFHCSSPCEIYRNCTNNSCHRHMITCDTCHEKTEGVCGSCIVKYTEAQSA